jgi:F-type H+-transporting ATPase subunit epsilon
MAELTVRVVATDRMVWTGGASLVVFDTLDGQIGIMAKHSPMMAVLRDAPVLIRSADDGDLYAAVHGGFVTVDGNNVIILAETAEMAGDIVREAVDKEIADVGTPAEDDVAGQKALERAQVRLATLDKASAAKSR